MPVNGRRMLDHLIDRFAPFVERLVVVAHPAFSAAVERHLAREPQRPYAVAEQAQPTGMLDAILAAAPLATATAADRVWIVWCDQVAVLPETLERMSAAEQGPTSPALLFPTVERDGPYIHFPRDERGRISGVLQRREGDEMPQHGESDMGVFSLSADAYTRQLPAFAAECAAGAGTGERNFLPFIPWLARTSDVMTVPCTDPHEAIGINTPEDMDVVERWLRRRFPRQ